MTDDPDWRPDAARLAHALHQAGVLTAGWLPAFTAVPRHLFVPAFYDDEQFVDSRDPATDQDSYLSAVYADNSLVTQRAPVPGTSLSFSTSSSTMPSLMARMLDLLDVPSGGTVLEVGTGTGYNAALLCHRLGDTAITSIDIDPTLIDQARARLDQLGYHPHLLTGDGADGAPARAPFDRILATCAITEIPEAWITQLAPGGVIVADLRGELSSNLIRLDKTGPDTVTGRVQPDPGNFMWLRARADNPLRDGGTLATERHLDAPHERATPLSPEILDDPGLRFLTQLLIPGLDPPSPGTYQDIPVTILTAADGSWAALPAHRSNGGQRVSEAGPRQLWAEVEHAAAIHHNCGQPAPDRYGLTVTADGVRRLWLDNPNSTHRIELPRAGNQVTADYRGQG